MKHVLGPNHQNTIGTVNNLANVLNKQGRLEEAQKLYERVLSGQERVLGLNHEHTLNTVNNLATILFEQGRLEEAKKQFERTLSGYAQILGPNHFKTILLLESYLRLINNLRSKHTEPQPVFGHDENIIYIYMYI